MHASSAAQLGLLLCLCVPAAHAEQRRSAGPARVRLAISAAAVHWVDPVTMEATARPLINELVRRHPGLTCSVHTGIGSSKLLHGLIAGEFNAALLATPEYLALSGRARVKVAYRGSTTHQLQLLVHAASGIDSVSQLAGKRISLHAEEPIQRTYLENLLAREKLKPGSVSWLAKKDGRSPVLDLMLHEAAACVVSSRVRETMAELNPQIQTRLRILAHSEDLYGLPLVVRQDIDPTVLAAIQSALASLSDSERGRQLLRLFRTPRLVPVRDSDYDSYRRMLAEHRRHYGAREEE